MRFKNPEAALIALSKSNFRKRLRLKPKDILYIKEKGWKMIRKHIYDLAIPRITPAKIKNDGKQTPTKGHPVFISQHATATCCRDCLKKWHHIEKGKKLKKPQIEYISRILLTWLKKQYEKNEPDLNLPTQRKLFDM